MTDQCGTPHHHYPETLCTEPPGHYRPDRDSHAGPLIIDGRECGAAVWDEPKDSTMTDRPTVDSITSDQLDALHAALDRVREVLDDPSALDWRHRIRVALAGPACGAGSNAPNAIGDERCALLAGHEGRHADGTLTWPVARVHVQIAPHPDMQAGAQPAPPEHVDWQGILRGFQALLDAYPADLQTEGPAVRPRPLPAGLVARWRDTIRAARQQYANQTTKEN